MREPVHRIPEARVRDIETDLMQSLQHYREGVPVAGEVGRKLVAARHRVPLKANRTSHDGERLQDAAQFPC